MADEDRLLVVTHPVIGAIDEAEIVHAIPGLRERPWRRVEIAPLRADHGSLHEIDWQSARAEQERLFERRLRAELRRRSCLAYFGLAPIPLAMHLGYRVRAEVRADVYQRHHERHDWRWAAEIRSKRRCLLQPLSFPEHGSTDVGPLVVRVSTAHRIDPRETSEIVPSSLAQVDVAIAEPGLDALETSEAVMEVKVGFRRALERLKTLFPRTTEVHVFAAVPVGLAFLLGTQINPTVYPDVITYQYWAKDIPRYRRAIVLTEKTTSNAALSFGPSPVAAREADRLARSLDELKLEWSDPRWTELHDLLCSAVPEARSIRAILDRSGIRPAEVISEDRARHIWKDALDVAARCARLAALIHQLLRDPTITAYHDKLRKIVERLQQGLITP